MKVGGVAVVALGQRQLRGRRESDEDSDDNELGLGLGFLLLGSLCKIC